MQADVGTAGTSPPRGRDGDPLTGLELRAWRGMLAAHASMVRRLDADLRAHHGISLTSYEVLMLLGQTPSRRMRISELSAATLLSVSGVSRMVDRLARQGLVEKEACEEDGRGAQAVLTAMGRGRLRAARAAHLAAVRAGFLERFDEAELEALGGFWDRIVPRGP
jgi:DNA-binding MarR family transcriptional regulator